MQDGAIPELARGSDLRSAGLRADCCTVEAARTATNGITPVSDTGDVAGAAGSGYQLTGMASQARDIYSGDELEARHAGSEFVITTDDQAFLAHTAARAAEIPVGSRITARCTFSVVADYEWDAFDLPDLRADWQVRRLKIEYQARSAEPAGTLPGHPGTPLRSVEIDRMSRWDDDRDPAVIARYLLEVTPLRTAPDRPGTLPPG